MLTMSARIVHLGRKAVTKAKSASHWPTTQGKIIESEVRKRPGTNAIFRFKIEYEYEVGGMRYTSKIIGIGREIRSGYAAEQIGFRSSIVDAHSGLIKPVSVSFVAS